MIHEIEEFFGYLAGERCLAANTLAAYRNDLDQLTAYLASPRAVRLLAASGNGKATDGIRPADVTRESVADFFLFLKEERRYSPATIARKMAAVKSLCQYLLKTGSISRNPAAEIGTPEVKKPLPRALSVDDVLSLVAQVDKRQSPEGLRDGAMLRLLYATGMRVTELVSLDLRDLDQDEAAIKCVGRGGRERVLPIEPGAMLALRIYLSEGRGRLARGGATEALFLNHRGQRLTRQGFWLIMKSLARESGVSAPVTPHTLRHSFAAHRLRAGVALPRLRYLLGHANLSTTQIYTRLSSQQERPTPSPALATPVG